MVLLTCVACHKSGYVCEEVRVGPTVPAQYDFEHLDIVMHLFDVLKDVWVGGVYEGAARGGVVEWRRISRTSSEYVRIRASRIQLELERLRWRPD